MNKKQIELLNDDAERLEETRDFGDSIFEESYRRAYRMLDEIIGNEKKKWDGIDEKRKYGNIIAFLGGRGSGKTSAMNSFAYSLSQYHLQDHKFYSLKKVSPTQTRFIMLGHIDVSSLESGEDVFQIILARMSREYDSLLERSSYSSGDYEFEKREIHRKFDLIYRNFQNLNRRERKDAAYGSSSLSALNYLSTSSEVRKEFADLVKSYRVLYARFLRMNEEECQNIYLMVSIDDIDMNVEAGFSILEQIERYLMIPGMIVLLASNYEQIEILGEKHFIEMFAKINKDMKESQIEYANKTSREYLEKIMPIQHRIYMPNFNNRLSKFSERLQVKEEGEPVKRTILGKIARRTGIYFDGCNTKGHFLEATSLRELNDFYSFLNELQKVREIQDSEEQVAVRKYNLERFLQEVMSRFSFKYLKQKQRKLIDDICFLGNGDKNRYLLFYIRKRMNNDEKMLLNSMEDADDSYGTLLLGLYLFSRHVFENKKLGHMILIIYSLLLNECIDSWSYSDDNKVNVPLNELLNGSVVSSWANDIMPMLRSQVPVESYYGSEHSPTGYIKKARIPEGFVVWRMNATQSLKSKSMDEMEKWFWENRQELIALELMMFFWENLTLERVQEDTIQQIELRWADYSSDDYPDESYSEVVIENLYGDYSIFAFIMNSYYYQNTFEKIHIALADAILGKGEEGEKKRLKEIFERCGMYGEYVAWGGDMADVVAIPFQHTDIFYHILDRLRKKRAESLPSEVSGEEIVDCILQVYRNIGLELEAQDLFYDHKSSINSVVIKERPWDLFSGHFYTCPFIRYVLGWGGIREAPSGKVPKDFKQRVNSILTNISRTKIQENPFTLWDDVSV